MLNKIKSNTYNICYSLQRTNNCGIFLADDVDCLIFIGLNEASSYTFDFVKTSLLTSCVLVIILKPREQIKQHTKTNTKFASVSGLTHKPLSIS